MSPASFLFRPAFWRPAERSNAAAAKRGGPGGFDQRGTRGRGVRVRAHGYVFRFRHRQYLPGEQGTLVNGPHAYLVACVRCSAASPRPGYRTPPSTAKMAPVARSDEDPDAIRPETAYMPSGPRSGDDCRSFRLADGGAFKSRFPRTEQQREQHVGGEQARGAP